MTILTRAKVTLLWRRYGPDIEWSATIDPPPCDGYERCFEWAVQRRKAELVGDPVRAAMFDLGGYCSRWNLYADPLVVTELLDVREPPKLGNLDETCGQICEDGLDLHFAGACPVQGHGILDGQLCYYRSRGRGWSFCVWSKKDSEAHLADPKAEDYIPSATEEWSYDKRGSCAFPDAGWLHRDESIKNLREALVAWRARIHP